MKYSMLVGILAAALLIISCFIPWTYYPDIDKTFTGFFSQANAYGKPGKAIIFFSILSIILFIIPTIWAKRLNVLITAITIAYCIRSYALFTGCAGGVCPEKKIGIFSIIVFSTLMIIAALLPDLKLKDNQK
ncbi:MAG TPA: hypothetical protein VKR53_08810 [Puia sp.]|nr:hypothetical protein [Puia sp.]